MSQNLLPKKKERCECYDKGRDNWPAILTDFRKTNICQSCLKPHNSDSKVRNDTIDDCRLSLIKGLEGMRMETPRYLYAFLKAQHKGHNELIDTIIKTLDKDE